MTRTQENKPSWASIFLYSAISSHPTHHANLMTQVQSQGVGNTSFPGLGHDKAVDDTGRVEEIGPIIK